MAKVYLLTFATASFRQSVGLLRLSARRYGVDEVFAYSPADIANTEFGRKNAALLSAPRGAGFWAWKSYLLLERLHTLAEDDVLIYCDAGIEIIGDLTPLIEISRSQGQPVVVSDFMRLNREWTKRDCFLTMGVDEPRFYDAPQVVGGFNLHRRTPETLQILEEWMKYAVDDHCNTDAPSRMGQPELEGFKENRHDQSILSLLVAKYEVPIYRDPTRYATHWEGYAGDVTQDPQWRSNAKMAPSPYGALIDVHRLRNKNPRHIIEMLRRSLRHRLQR